MAKYKIVIIAFLLIANIMAWGQTPQEQYEAFRRQAQGQYNDFRRKANADYAEFVKKAWQKFEAKEPVTLPKEEPVPPVVCPKEEKDKERKDEPKPFEEEVIIPQLVSPQPEPIAPIIVPEPVAPSLDTLKVEFYGTEMCCVLAKRLSFKLKDVYEESVSETIKQMSSDDFDALLSQCLSLRKRYCLNDWAYLQLLDKVSNTLVQNFSNEATLLMAWLYCQSGYRMRIARAGNNLHLLYATDNIVFNKNCYILNDVTYYVYGTDVDDLYICDFEFPKEQTMTFGFVQVPLLTVHKSSNRELQSQEFPNLAARTVVNSNLIDFYNDYPKASVSPIVRNSWAICANTPLSEAARQSLYPSLQEAIKGKSKLQAAEELLNFVQTAFVYEYDSVVWGDDRAFFPEETLFYPFSDCEDRAILFSRIVRDLLGLNVVLIYYPGHLATAVRFDDEQPTGGYLQLDDGRYFIADPTYTNAPIGLQMPKMRDKQITVVRLD